MNTKIWSGAEIEHLIELYRNERCSWDSSDADYLDADLRQAALQRISTEFAPASTAAIVFVSIPQFSLKAHSIDI